MTISLAISETFSVK